MTLQSNQYGIPHTPYTRYGTYGYYEKQKKEYVDSLFKSNSLIEGEDYFWADDDWISVWELWILPVKRQYIYDIIHHPKNATNNLCSA